MMSPQRKSSSPIALLYILTFLLIDFELTMKLYSTDFSLIKNPMTDALHVWKEELKDDFDRDFIIKGVAQGFDLLADKKQTFQPI